MNTTLYLIRHAQVYNPDGLIYGRTVDVPLSDEGFAQAEKLAQTLSDLAIKPEAIYSSPLTRALQTSKAISDKFIDLPIIKLEDLTDSDEPELVHMSIDWYRSIDGDIYNHPDSKHLISEFPDAMVERTMRALTHVKEQHVGKEAIVVGHGSPFAFTKWHLMYPDKELPPVPELKRNGVYPEKVEAWRVVLDEHLQAIEYETIGEIRSKIER